MKVKSSFLSSISFILCAFVIFFSSCNKDDGPDYGSLVDIDGNNYKTIAIGTQTWMVENLATTKYNDGSEIPNVVEDSEWKELNTAGYCWYENDIDYKDPYGALYNWYTVETGKLCPTGWHVPTYNDMKQLLLNIGISSDEIDKSGYIGTVEGSLLKTTTGWYNNGNGTNQYNFNFIGSGFRHQNEAYFNSITENGYMWSSTEKADDNSRAWRFAILYSNDQANLDASYKNYGLSVRCIKD